jgi:hypothetical protein
MNDCNNHLEEARWFRLPNGTLPITTTEWQSVYQNVSQVLVKSILDKLEDQREDHTSNP